MSDEEEDHVMIDTEEEDLDEDGAAGGADGTDEAGAQGEADEGGGEAGDDSEEDEGGEEGETVVTGDGNKEAEGFVKAPDRAEIAALAVPRLIGPIEKLITLGNAKFAAAMIPWETAEAMRVDRETAALLADLGAVPGGDKKGKKKKKSSKKKKKKAKGKDSGKTELEAVPLTPDQLLAHEEGTMALAVRLFVQAERLYQRALNLIMKEEDGTNNEFYPVACLNMGESFLRRGADESAKQWIQPIVTQIDIPGRMTGAMIVAAQDLLLVPARMWWPKLMPEEPKVAKKAKKGKRGKGGSKKKGKGSKKGKGKKKKK
mmetsp:Transcript_20419/g.53130  ORF Transcript_20419/g.53130 Transcript_20419/m.53130 type:complete len:316 (-) Transcript_20419:1547-2494(-)